MAAMDPIEKYLSEATGESEAAESGEGVDESAALGQALLDALDSRDAASVYEAVAALAAHCDAMPHIEGEHDDGDEDMPPAGGKKRHGPAVILRLG